MTHYQSALRWIVGVLEKHQVPFVITGGLAAKAYGVVRDLYDIDLDIPNDRFGDILEEVKQYVISGPARYEDEHWRLFTMALQYDGWTIDVSGAEDAETFNRQTNKWVPCPTDLTRFELRDIEGKMFPVMRKEDLIAYKRLVGRDTDVSDVKEILG